MGYPRAGIRWREDVGWELRCSDCAEAKGGVVYWPLTDEFWDKRNMKRCRACIGAAKRRWEKRANRNRRESRAAYALRYRQEAGDYLRQQHAIWYWADPETHRARARKHYYANRDAILQRRRERYALRKAA